MPNNESLSRRAYLETIVGKYHLPCRHADNIPLPCAPRETFEGRYSPKDSPEVSNSRENVAELTVDTDSTGTSVIPLTTSEAKARDCLK